MWRFKLQSGDQTDNEQQGDGFYDGFYDLDWSANITYLVILYEQRESLVVGLDFYNAQDQLVQKMGDDVWE